MENSFNLKITNKTTNVRPVPGDLVNLIFIAVTGEEESLWVEIKLDNKNHFVGILKNNPAKMYGILSLGDEVVFDVNHILAVADRKTINKLIEKKKSENYYGDRIKACINIMEKWIGLSSNKGEYLIIYKIKAKDKNFYRESIRSIRSNDAARDVLEDTQKMFLSLVFAIVLPQLIRNVREYLEYETIQTDAHYLKKLIETIEESKEILRDIKENNLRLLEEFREKMGGWTETDQEVEWGKELDRELTATKRLLEDLR